MFIDALQRFFSSSVGAEPYRFQVVQLLQHIAVNGAKAVIAGGYDKHPAPKQLRNAGKHRAAAFLLVFTVVILLTASSDSNTASLAFRSARNIQNSSANASVNPTVPSHTLPTGTLARTSLENLSRSPLAFERNNGQTDREVQFLSRALGYNLFLTGNQAILEFVSHNGTRQNGKHSKVLGLELAGANRQATLTPEHELPGRSNYFIGNDPSLWHVDVPTFAKVRNAQVYPGIDLVYYGNGRQLEFDFELAPFADPETIKLNVTGAERIRVAANGDLILKTHYGTLRQNKPVIYQQVDKRKTHVDGRYVLLGKNKVGFQLATYDESLPLTIDPVLIYSTYLGGGGNDFGNSIAVDPAGSVYVTGETNSVNFPTKNPYQPAVAGNSDVFVAKFDSASNQVYSTYIGGSGLDRGDGIAVDSDGNAYIVGRVDSASENFPTTIGSFQHDYRGGDFDGFVTKLNPQGNGLTYSSFLGGADNDSAVGVFVDSAFSAFVTGGTKSADFPTTPNVYQSSNAGDTDGFVIKLNAAGSAATYCTLVGGLSTDRGSGLAVDSGGNAFLTGLTRSTDFPTLNAFQNTFGGSFDAFVLKLNPAATDVIFSTYLGGSGDDRGFGLALDSSDNCYVTGQTSSNNLPVLNALFPTFGGSFDAFVAKLDSGGAKLYTTYLGGSGDDRATAIAVGANQPSITGFTTSTNFPLSNPLQPANAGGTDVFITKLNAAGTAPIYSTYLGGNANDNFNNQNITYSGGIAADNSGNAYVTGFTFSSNFPTATPFQGANAGSSDAFILKLADTGSSGDFSVGVSPAHRLVVPGGMTTYDITLTPSGGFTGVVNLSINGLPANAGSSFNPPSVNITASSSVTSTLTVTTTAATPLGNFQLTVTGTSGSLQRNATTTLNVVSPTSADLSLVKTGSPNPAVVGINLSYRIVVTNNGPAMATNVTVIDTLPAGITFVSATPTQGTCLGTSTVTCNLGSLLINANPSVTIVVTPNQAVPISNTASVAATETDPISSNNSQTITTNVQMQASGPTILDPNLTVSTVFTGLNQPTSMAFLNASDLLVLEKTTGKVQRIVNGALQSTVLDLGVNGASERGLLGIALHPDFAMNGFVYLYWTESSTGIDTSNIDEIPLLGNRVDRYIWNGSTLAFDRNLIRLRSLQQDANQPSRGNHNAGVLRFGLDGKLYILFGDNGRRGFLQNLTSGGPVPDDQFGGPEPDNAHLSGVILRLNDDGTTPTDNPFFAVNSGLTGEAAANIKRVFAYGVRNGFGMAVDPLSGSLWTQENGDDAFDEMNRVRAGFNGGWVQIIGPVSRIAEYKLIESTYGPGNLQQLRWSPTNIAETPATALARLYMLPGAQYTDPEFSWKYAVAPASLGFVKGRGLGPQFEGNMFVGASRTTLVNGYLFCFKFTGDRQHFLFTDSRLADLVADNVDKFDLGESESLLIGRDFGITTDVETGPNGNVFVVSLSNGAVYEIKSKPSQLFVATLNGAQEVPPTNSTATGTATLALSADEMTARVSLNFSGLSSEQTAAHIHGAAGPGVAAPIIFPLPLGQFSDFQINLLPAQVQDLKNGLYYINVHSTMFSGGEIRGQFQSSPAASSIQFNSTSYVVNEGEGSATIEVRRAGDTSSAVTIDYATSDATAGNRTDYVVSSGTLHFAAGETIKTFTVPIVDDLYVEGNESLNLTLSKAAGGAFSGSPSTVALTILDNDTATPTTNPLDGAQFFVNQQYLDFLNREPDAGGLAYWTNEITHCGNDTACINSRRLGVSAAFFIEAEFQQSGSFVYRLYKGGLGRQPNYAEFTLDRSKVVGGVEADKAALVNDFIQRPEFKSLYPDALTNAQFVNRLFDTAGLTPFAAERQQQIDAMNAGKTRAQVVRDVVEIQAFKDREYNPSFVLMQYFGYLRRDPDSGGYAFWLDVLNNRDRNNYRGLVCAFITSREYQERFSSVVTRTDAECPGPK
jgi:uncharacterized repeat protein (TIGR01451 family)